MSPDQYNHNARTTLKNVLDQRDRAAYQAIVNMGRYKFDRFGYYAARWVTLNKLLPKDLRKANPFRDFVRLARDKRDNEYTSGGG